MSIGYLDSQKLTDIANAIRSKNGEESSYTPSQMPQKILDIPSPKRGISQWKQVAVIDYDGTLIADYTRQEALALTSLPIAPDHSQDELPLAFEKYNWTLAEVKDHLTNHPQLNITVGALYRSTDALSHFIYNIDDDRLTIHIKVTTNGSDYQGRYFDWGDGTITNFSSYVSDYSHTYTTQGRYHVKLKAPIFSFSDNYVRDEHGPETFSVGTEVTSYESCAFFRAVELLKAPLSDIPLTSFASNNQPRQIEALVLSANSSNFILNNNYLCNLRIISLPAGYICPQSTLSLSYNPYLERCDIPYGSTSRFDGISGTNIRSFTFPSSMGSLNMFSSNYKIEKITFEEGVTSLPSGIAISNTYNLKELYLPSTLTEIQYMFSPCSPSLTIWCYSQTPPTLPSEWRYIKPWPKKVYIPYGTYQTYSTNQYWSEIAVLLEEMPQTT